MEKGKNKKKGLLKILSNAYVKTFLAMAIIGGILIWLAMYGLKVYTKHGESVVVPSVMGMQVEEAATILQKSDLNYEVVDSIFLTGGTPGGITDQIPEEGSFVKKNRTIYLTMQAKSIEQVAIPPLKDFSQRQAIATLSSLGFNNVKTIEVPSIYKGLVIDVSYKGKSLEPYAKVPKGDIIELTVGAGGEVYIDSLIDVIPEIDTQHPQDNNDNNTTIDNSFFE